jgi:predicted acyltransferase
MKNVISNTLKPKRTDSTETVVQRDKPSRLLSLDALRGFDMFWIISGEGIFHGLANIVVTKHLLYRNPADWQIATTDELNFWERMAVGISNELHHTPWNGFTFYDMIFPLFIFIAGISMPFSFSKQLQKPGVNMGIAKKYIYRSLLKRTIILIFLGTIVNGALQFKSYHDTRFASVLARIALSCFFAAIIYLNFNLRKQLIWFALLLLGYWVVMVLIPVPGYGAGVLTPEGNLSAYIDRILLPGKLHRVVYDPEGLLSTIPAIGSALLGVFTGQFLRYQKYTSAKKSLVLAASGIVLVLVGLLCGIIFPVNKNMWTSSFVLYAGGWSVLLFTLFYFIIDVVGLKKWSMPFVWIGSNSILIYMAAHGVVNFESTSLFLFGGLYNKTPEVCHQAFMWTGVALIQLAFLYFLYKKKWFLKV